MPGVKKAAVPGTDSSSPCAHHTGKEPWQLAPHVWAEAAKLLCPWPRFATCQRKAKCCRMIKQEPWTGAHFIGCGNERWWFGTSLTTMFGIKWTISSGGRKPTEAFNETCRKHWEMENVPTSSVLAGLHDFSEWLISVFSELQCWYWIPETKWNTNPLWKSHVQSYSTHQLPVPKNSSWGKSISDRLHQTSPA